MAANATSGNIVVPLSTVLDQLQGKLSDSELNALLLTLVPQRTREVRPGDLITSELFNQILADIADLAARVAQLEEGGVAGPGQLELTLPVDGAQYRAGEDMVIEGKNLGFADGTSLISIDGVRATDYRKGSSDTRITVKIPAVSTPTADGRDVVLVVSNGTSSAVRTVRIRPAQDLAGAVDVTWTAVSPNPIVAGQAVTFELVLKSRANLDASYRVDAVVSQVSGAAAWNAATTVLLQGTPVPSRMVPVAAGADRTVQVRIDPVPAVAAGTTFSLSVAATSGAVVGTTGRIRLAVGQVTLPDASVSLSISTADFFPAGSGALSRGTELDSVSVQRTATSRLTLLTRVKEPGEYLATITPISSPGTPTTGWTLVRHPQDPVEPGTSNTLYSYFNVTQQQISAAGSDGVTLAPRFNLTPTASASELGEAELKIERRNSGKSRTRLIGLTAT